MAKHWRQRICETIGRPAVVGGPVRHGRTPPVAEPDAVEDDEEAVQKLPGTA